MSVWLASDLHLGPRDTVDTICPHGGDPKGLLILAGDVCEAHQTHLWQPVLSGLSKKYNSVLWLFGNHESRNVTHWRQLQDTMQAFADQHLNVTIVPQRGVVTWKGRRFVCATLWSHLSNKASDLARRESLDCQQISGWTPHAWNNAHFRDMAFLDKTVRRGDIVVTHHAPLRRGVADPRYTDPVRREWYGTDVLPRYKRRQLPAVHLFGHTHFAMDAVRQGVRICNHPRGNPKERKEWPWAGPKLILP